MEGEQREAACSALVSCPSTSTRTARVATSPRRYRRSAHQWRYDEAPTSLAAPHSGSAAAGRTDTLALLLERGVTLEARSADGYTPLLEACASFYRCVHTCVKPRRARPRRYMPWPCPRLPTRERARACGARDAARLHRGAARGGRRAVHHRRPEPTVACGSRRRLVPLAARGLFSCHWQRAAASDDWRRSGTSRS